MKSILLLALALSISAVSIAQDITIQLVADQGAIDGSTLQICQGTNVTFTAIVDYGASDGTDETTAFEWTISGTPSIPEIGLNSYGMNFDYPIGSSVMVTVIEPNSGAIATTMLEVQVSGSPDYTQFFADNADSMLLGQTQVLVASNMMGEQGYIPSVVGAYEEEVSNLDYFPIPDLIGTAAESTITISGATEGAVIDENQAIESIWVNMEHSFIGDLLIEIRCPDGTTVLLHEEGGGGINLGDPDQSDNTGLVGVGYDYFWSPTATLGIWSQEVFNGHLLPNATGGTSLISDIYSPHDSLEYLMTCPINGVWAFRILDLWAGDDGHLFGWGINFSDAVLLEGANYNTDISSLTWTDNPTIVSSDGGTISIMPTESGPQVYELQLIDETGCLHTVDYTINVLAPNGLSEERDEIGLVITQVGGEISISTELEQGVPLRLELYDAAGRMHHQETFKSNIQINSPGTGMYFLRVLDEVGRSSVSRIWLNE